MFLVLLWKRVMLFEACLAGRQHRLCVYAAGLGLCGRETMPPTTTQT